jgi:hypothetical protein
MVRLAILLIALASLVGCAYIQKEIEAEREAERVQREQEKANYIAYLQKKCEVFGFVKGTIEFANCMLKLTQRDVDNRNREADRRALIEARPKSCTTTSDHLGRTKTQCY